MKEGKRMLIATPNGELRKSVMSKLEQSGLRFTAAPRRLLHGGRKYTSGSGDMPC
jgi:ATP phosphoribosyltransferase